MLLLLHGTIACGTACTSGRNNRNTALNSCKLVLALFHLFGLWANEEIKTVCII